jgi:hypothetical protein
VDSVATLSKLRRQAQLLCQIDTGRSDLCEFYHDEIGCLNVRLLDTLVASQPRSDEAYYEQYDEYCYYK